MLLPRFQMMPWTAQEISLLIGLWPNASAAQISKQLNRSRGSVCGKAMRLRRDDLLPAGVEKHFEVNPALQTRPDPAKAMVTPIIPAKPTHPVGATVPLAMRRCSLLELDDGQCRWPLGDLHQVATQFCGGDAVPGLPYCRHHLRIAQRDSGLPSNGCHHRVNRGFSRIAADSLPVG
jgi:GcrA cell cycle regulator